MHSSNSTACVNNVSPQGTERCDHFTGQCICKPGVEVRTKEECLQICENRESNKYLQGRNCDRCQADHWGFASGTGCFACECSDASEHGQCDQVVFFSASVLFLCLLSSTMIHRQRANAFARTVSEDRSARTVSMDIGTSAPMDVSSVPVTLIMLSGEAVTRRLASAHVCPMWRGSTATVAQRITSSFRTSGGQDPSCQLGRSPLNMLTVASLVSPALRT